MAYHLLDERPVTLGVNGLTVWTEAGWPLAIRSKQTFFTVADDEGRVYLLNHKWRIRILKRTCARDLYYMTLSKKGPLFFIYPMLRLKSVLNALK